MFPPTGAVLTPDGKPAVALKDWCKREGISDANARGYYIPKERIPGAFKLGEDWYVPECSRLIRRGGGGRPRGSGRRS